MAMPRILQTSLTPDELEFIAECELVAVEPTARFPKIPLLWNATAPLIPLRKQQVPLWLALTLSERGLVKIVTPRWMSVDQLQKAVQEERTLQEFSAALPFRYMETAKLVLGLGSGESGGVENEIEDRVPISTLLQDVREIRRSKAREGLDNLGAMEINEIRTTFTTAFTTLKQLQSLSTNYIHDDDDDENSTQTYTGMLTTQSSHTH